MISSTTTYRSLARGTGIQLPAASTIRTSLHGSRTWKNFHKARVLQLALHKPIRSGKIVAAYSSLTSTGDLSHTRLRAGSPCSWRCVMARKATALNPQLQKLVAELAEKKGVGEEDVLLQAVSLLRFLDEKGAAKVTAKRADDTDIVEVAL